MEARHQFVILSGSEGSLKDGTELSVSRNRRAELEQRLGVGE